MQSHNKPLSLWISTFAGMTIVDFLPVAHAPCFVLGYLNRVTAIISLIRGLKNL